jgi:glutathione S-transferase
MAEIEIVSHPLCPHTQLLVIIGLLAGKRPNVDYKLTYLPYATLSQMLPKYSPTGELPILRLDGRLASDDTNAIAEYINGVLGLQLLPDDPEAKLKIRGGERLVSNTLQKLRAVFTTRDQAGLHAALKEFFDSLAMIETRLDGSMDPGALTHLGYIALAPVGSLVNQYAFLREHPRWQDLPKVGARIHAAGEHPIVNKAKCPNYAEEFNAFFAMTGSAFPTLINAI